MDRIWQLGDRLSTALSLGYDRLSHATDAGPGQTKILYFKVNITGTLLRLG